MAGEWIKFEIATLDKPEVIRMSRALGISKETVCGWLIRFWGWYSANSVDGSVDGVASTDVDVVLALPGFASALKSVGWLVEESNPQKLVIPNFEFHNSESAKKRALKTRRQAKYRDGLVDGAVSTSASPEKRREEVKDKATPPDGGSTVWDFGKSLLTEQGLSRQAAGGLLGSWLRDWDESTVADAIRSAAGKADAKAYVMAILKDKPRKGGAASGPKFDA
jgi:hypothetical protein